MDSNARVHWSFSGGIAKFKFQNCLQGSELFIKRSHAGTKARDVKVINDRKRESKTAPVILLTEVRHASGKYSYEVLANSVCVIQAQCILLKGTAFLLV